MTTEILIFFWNPISKKVLTVNSRFMGYIGHLSVGNETNSLFYQVTFLLPCNDFYQLRLFTNSIFLPTQFFLPTSFFLIFLFLLIFFAKSSFLPTHFFTTFFFPSHFFVQVTFFQSELVKKVTWKIFSNSLFLPTETFSNSLSFLKGRSRMSRCRPYFASQIWPRTYLRRLISAFRSERAEKYAQKLRIHVV